MTAGKRVLLARADRGRDLLPRELAKVAEVEQISVYCQVDVTQADPEILNALAVRRALRTKSGPPK